MSCAPTPHKLNRFAVLGCAHNEAAVIEQLIQSLYATVYPKNSYDIYIICDNCTDNTADMVRKAGAIAMERHDAEHRGKGFGLEWMFAKLDAERKKGNVYDAYIVLDADNLVNESFLDEINYKLNEGYEILQAYLGCKNPTDTWISRCYSYAYWVSDAQYQEAHSRVGLTAQMGGTGMVLRPKVLDEVGWMTDSLTEDLVLTSRYLLATNRACCWVEKAKLYDEKYWVSTVHTRSMSIDEVREDAVLQEAKERLCGLDNIHRLPLGQILLKAAVITRGQLDEALAIQKERGGFLGDIIVETRAIASETLDAYLSIQREMKDIAPTEGAGGATPRIGEILTDSGLITPVQLEAALSFQTQHNVLLGEAIIATHIMPLELLKSFLDVQKVLDMNYVSRDSAKHLINGLLAARTENLGTIL